MEIKVGILGCANIARKNIRAIKLSYNTKLVAIASRSLVKAKKFAKDNDVDDECKIYGSYDELLNDNDVDLVYLPLPTSQHLEWATKVANAYKHILIEKPCAENSEELMMIIEQFQSKHLFYMDAVMFMHNPILNRLRKTLSDPMAGKIYRINSSFSFKGSAAFFEENIRVKKDGDKLGALGDLGWYNIRLAIISFLQGKDIEVLQSTDNIEYDHLILPRFVKAISYHRSADGVPLDCDAEIIFGTEDSDQSRKQIFKFDCSFLLPIRQTYEISLTNDNNYCDKVIRGNYFVLPRCPSEASFVIESSLASYGDNATRNLCNIETISENVLTNQEVSMFNTLSEKILSNNEIDTLYWKRISLLTQLTVDACYQSLNNNSETVKISYDLLTRIRV